MKKKEKKKKSQQCAWRIHLLLQHPSCRKDGRIYSDYTTLLTGNEVELIAERHPVSVTNCASVLLWQID